MSISQRKFRALIGTYKDAGSSGDVASQYVRQSSSASDYAWWASKSAPTGTETTLGMKAEHRVDIVVGLAAAAPVSENGALQIDAVDYLVRAVLPKEYGTDEVQVLAERSAYALTWVTA